MLDFATVADVIAITGNEYTAAEQDRISVLIPMVSALIVNAGTASGVDVELLVSSDDNYAAVVKMVVCDVVVRVMRQNTDGEPMSQESQSALGYSWSGSYAVPGGGVAMSLMRNERKILGFKRQKYGAMDIWER